MPPPQDVPLRQLAEWCLRRALTRVLREPLSLLLRLANRELASRGLLTRAPKSQRRRFPAAVRDECWGKAPTVPGRDPERWRLDAAGNLVLRELNGCEGVLCFTFDHVVPLVKGGDCSLENCQILQTTANFWKADKTGVSREQLQRASKSLEMSDRDMDAIEIGIYGNCLKGQGSPLDPRQKLKKAKWPPCDSV